MNLWNLFGDLVIIIDWHWWLTEAGAGIGGIATFFLGLLYLGLYYQNRSQTQALEASYSPVLDVGFRPDASRVELDITNRGEGVATNIEIEITVEGINDRIILPDKLDKEDTDAEVSPNEVEHRFLAKINQSLSANSYFTNPDRQYVTNSTGFILNPKFYIEERDRESKIGDIVALNSYLLDRGYDRMRFNLELRYEDILGKHQKVVQKSESVELEEISIEGETSSVYSIPTVKMGSNVGFIGSIRHSFKENMEYIRSFFVDDSYIIERNVDLSSSSGDSH